jgi:uncharacterized Zn-finger protein
MNKHTEKFKCDTCGLCKTSKKALETHQMTHTGEKPHKCRKCNKGFARSDTCKIHMTTCKVNLRGGGGGADGNDDMDNDE